MTRLAPWRNHDHNLKHKFSQFFFDKENLGPGSGSSGGEGRAAPAILTECWGFMPTLAIGMNNLERRPMLHSNQATTMEPFWSMRLNLAPLNKRTFSCTRRCFDLTWGSNRGNRLPWGGGTNWQKHLLRDTQYPWTVVQVLVRQQLRELCLLWASKWKQWQQTN
jgi:hypothetical protein